MKIVIAPDSFKESLTGLRVCEAVEKGIKAHFPNAEISKVPMADGGEGTVQSLVDATGGEIIQTRVTGPLGKEVEAFTEFLETATRLLLKWRPLQVFIMSLSINEIRLSQQREEPASSFLKR